jgi:hypothetical protein
LADGQRLDEVTDGALVVAQEVQDPTAVGLGQRGEGGGHPKMVRPSSYACQGI